MPFLISQRKAYMQPLLSATNNRLLLTAITEQLMPGALPGPISAWARTILPAATHALQSAARTQHLPQITEPMEVIYACMCHDDAATETSALS